MSFVYSEPRNHYSISNWNIHDVSDISYLFKFEPWWLNGLPTIMYYYTIHNSSYSLQIYYDERVYLAILELVLLNPTPPIKHVKNLILQPISQFHTCFAPQNMKRKVIYCKWMLRCPKGLPTITNQSCPLKQLQGHNHHRSSRVLVWCVPHGWP